MRTVVKSSYQSVFIILAFFREISSIANDSELYSNFSDSSCGKYFEKYSRIVGGSKAAPNEFPWIVSIKHRGSHICGGVIVNKKWVITAAHCFCRENGVQNILISKIKIHFGYACNKLENDIALLEMDRDISWLNADPACFPVDGKSEFLNFSRTNGIAAGWGATNEDFSKGKMPVILHKVQLPILQNDECQRWYNSQNKTLYLRKSQMCAGYEKGGKDTCWADSGGPLMVRRGVKMVVVGIVSTGIGCARASLPGIYTRLSEFMNWIALTIM
ncbi:clotting factor G beta subunit-like isoform X2 [Planococcus citri]|uniref:clotting factor G beta subunit-like isoform X2 n=1 Tax=Planococcus citri TaxID=170843 RepID=UPI0031F9A9D6